MTSSSQPDSNQIVHALVVAPAAGESARDLIAALQWPEQIPFVHELTLLAKDGYLISMVTDEYLVYICYRSPGALIPLTLSLAQALGKPHAGNKQWRICTHTGPIHSIGWISSSRPASLQRIREIRSSSDWLIQNAKVLRAAQEILRMADPGQILVSDSFRREISQWAPFQLAQAGIAQAGAESIPVWTAYTDSIGTRGQAAGRSVSSPKLKEQAEARQLNAVILFRQKTAPDEEIAEGLENALRQAGCSVFVDRHQSSGLAWAQLIHHHIAHSDVIVPIVSKAALQSELFAYEMEMAHTFAEQPDGPSLLPVRAQFSEALPEPFDVRIGAYEFRWNSEREQFEHSPLLWTRREDEQQICQEIMQLEEMERRHTKPRTRPAIAPGSISIEPAGGAVALDSPFYIRRSADDGFSAALESRDSIILLKGPRQMGKTSLLARGLHQARQHGAKVVLTDLQKFSSQELANIPAFLRALSEMIASQLGIENAASQVWERNRSPNIAFEHFLRREVLNNKDNYLVWAIDEFDRIFSTPFATEVCALFRSWHNERVLEPDGPWSQLTIAIAYATEAHLFISDLNQSPFNVGTRLSLDNFSLEQVTKLNELYGSPLKSEPELHQLFELTGGHPYLIRRGLQELVERNIELAVLLDSAAEENGAFGEHLCRLLASLVQDKYLCQVVRNLVRYDTPPAADDFYRLRSAGVLTGSTSREGRLRCRLYEQYLCKQLG